MKLLRQLRFDDRGQDLIEYALLAGFVALLAGTVMPTVPNNITRIFTKVSNELTEAGGL
jgi:pilus assembly protein Flp/PilA